MNNLIKELQLQVKTKLSRQADPPNLEVLKEVTFRAWLSGTIKEAAFNQQESVCVHVPVSFSDDLINDYRKAGYTVREDSTAPLFGETGKVKVVWISGWIVKQ